MINISVALLLLLLIALLAIFQMRARRGKLPEIRQISGLDAMEEGVGRAVELGRPVSFHISAPDLLTGGKGASGGVSSLVLLGHVARLAARQDAQFVFLGNTPDMCLLATDTVQAAFIAEDKKQNFNAQEMIRYYPTDGFMPAFAGYFFKEKPAVSIMMGDMGTNTVFLCEVSYNAGAMTITACSRETQVATFACLCDYFMVGEELLVASAYISKNAPVLGSIQGQDIIKLLLVGAIALGSILTTVGVPYIQSFFKL